MITHGAAVLLIAAVGCWRQTQDRNSRTVITKPVTGRGELLNEMPESPLMRWTSGDQRWRMQAGRLRGLWVFLGA